jgi:hypothetical protein
VTVIPRQTVDAARRSVSAFSQRQGRETMERASREQPALLAFVLAYTKDLSPGAQGLALVLFTVVWQIFERASGRRVPRIKARTLEAVEASEQWLLKLSRALKPFLARAAVVRSSRQPHVFRYITGAIMEAPGDPDEPVELTDDEVGTLFFVLEVVVGLLDEACRT